MDDDSLQAGSLSCASTKPNSQHRACSQARIMTANCLKYNLLTIFDREVSKWQHPAWLDQVVVFCWACLFSSTNYGRTQDHADQSCLHLVRFHHTEIKNSVQMKSDIICSRGMIYKMSNRHSCKMPMMPDGFLACNTAIFYSHLKLYDWGSHSLSLYR